MANERQKARSDRRKSDQTRHGGPKDSQNRPARRQTGTTHDTNRKGANPKR
jgi:hypothetical protein